MTGVGRTYNGTVNTSWSGEKCLAWNKQNYDTGYQSFYSNNFCRNPGPPGTAPVTKPWCFSADPDKKWETCDNIRECYTCDKGKDPLYCSAWA